MKPARKKYFFAAAALAFCLAAAGARAQSLPPVGYATNFSSVTYFDAPHEQQIEYRLSGAEGSKDSPLPGALFNFTQMKVEKFTAAGKLEAVVEAPRCTYSPLDRVANSDGHLNLIADDGRFKVEGDGFLWRQTEQSLVISNHVRTVIDRTAAVLPSTQRSQP